MSLSNFVFWKVSDSFFIIYLTVIFGIGEVCLSVLLSVVLLYGCDASGSTIATTAVTNIEWFDTSTILFSVAIVCLWSTSYLLWRLMSLCCSFKPSIIIFIKKDCRRRKFSSWFGSVVISNSHILDATLNVVTALIGHYPLSSIYHIWIHSIPVWLLRNRMNISKLRALDRSWSFVIQSVDNLSL